MRTRAFLLAAIVMTTATGLQRSTSASAGGDANVPPAPPRLLSQAGLYVPGSTSVIDSRNRAYAPQYPLWTDDAQKSRWVYLPPGATIDASDSDLWDFPVGTRFWKEFAFGGRKVETRMLWKGTATRWVFATYAWNDAQTDATLAPEDGIAGVVEVAPGKRHSIPSIADCHACHDPTGRTWILGFTALQLSTDRDPNAIHGSPFEPGAVTLTTLIDEGRLHPAHREWITTPPRIPGPPRTRTVLGYLSGNCGHCHNKEGALSGVGLVLHQTTAPDAASEVLDTLLKPGRWELPNAPAGSAIVTPGSPELSKLLYRMHSRRPMSQMPPLGTVIEDREAVEAVTAWIRDDLSWNSMNRATGTQSRRETP